MKNLILTLLNLDGIDRKIVCHSLKIKKDTECTEESIILLANEAIGNGIKLPAFTKAQISEAMNRARATIDICKEKEVGIVTYFDDNYPKKLYLIKEPPAVLYYRGNIDCLNENRTVAIIGTRTPTEYGFSIAKNLGSSFGKRDYIVVGGLATGCDTGGHLGCLAVNGKTIAVLAGGLDDIYPAENKALADRILEGGGALLSEYPPGTKMLRHYFVERDRIESGLSDGVLVVETKEKGGTMHTVNYMLKEKGVVGCYKHPEEYRTYEVTYGNQALLREGKAMSISDDASLIAFRARMEAYAMRLNESTYEQRTIAEYLTEE